MEAILKSASASAQAAPLRGEDPSAKPRPDPGAGPAWEGPRTALPAAAGVAVLRLPTRRLTGKAGSGPLLDGPPSF